MNDVALPPGYLGAVTEARFAEVFSSTALATASSAAKLIGVDPKTLGDMTEREIIRSVPRGKLPAYTERDLRAYLLEGPATPCRSTSRPRAASSSTTRQITSITDMATRRIDGQRSKSNLRARPRN